MFNELRRRSSSTIKSIPLSKESSEDTSDSKSTGSNRKADQVKRLETKVTELALALREKNARLDELNREMEQKSAEHHRELELVRSECTHLAEKLSELQANQINQSKTLLKAEQELDCYRKQALEHISQVDQHRLEIARLREENRAIQSLLDEARLARTQAEEVSRGYRLQVDELINLKEEQHRQIESLTDQLSNAMLERNGYREQAAQETANANDTVQELEHLRSQLTTVTARGKTRENDLQDHINLLEQRLSIFTNISPTMDPHDANRLTVRSDVSIESEPDSVIGDSVLSDDATAYLDLSSISTTTAASGALVAAATASDSPAPMPSNVASGAGDVRTSPVFVSALLRERAVLTARLEAMRAQLVEAKTQWNDCLVSLERQIGRLNRKMTQDAAEHEKQRLDDQMTIGQLKREVTSLKEQLCQANNTVRVTEERSAARSIEAETKAADWIDQRVQLLAIISGLTEQSEHITRERNTANERLVTLEQEMEELKRQSQAATARLLERDQELESNQGQLREVMCELNRLKSDHQLCENRLTAVSEEIQRYKSELDELGAEKQQKENALAGALEKIHVLETDQELQRSSNHARVQELQNELSDSRRVLQKQIEEMDTLRQKLAELARVDESFKEATVSCSGLEEQVRQKEQIIRVQQKRLRELQRAVSDLRDTKRPPPGHTAPTIGLSPPRLSDKSVPASQPNSSSTISPCDNEPTPAVQFYNTNSRNNNNNNHTSIRDRLFRRMARSSKTTGTRHNVSTLAIVDPLTSDSPNGMAPPLSAVGSSNLSSSDESINSHYLRHVVVKFLLSREREAMHLIRVLTTLLRMTADEEQLLRLQLQSRRKWFSGSYGRRVSAVSPSLVHGQFAKIIPPS